ncbi:hypothetical protein ML462_15245 [Gramella lutea]|uniref:DUF4890 domain-containing protein n=1 Tax=Christiangramia lutea TaxID=1607951 RepID=A0A9X1V506_9FLAO|nr:hypothetical protein [Christiangramia lutea]MCH4824527.1 hypothetical protein [Christiangramia lutea]
MKKILTVIFVLLSLSMFSQQKSERKSDLTKDEMARLRADRLAMQLDLDEDQKEKLKGLFAERIEAQEKMREERREMKEEKQQFNEKQKEELSEILTEEQFTKWEGLQEKRRKGRKHYQEKRKN